MTLPVINNTTYKTLIPSTGEEIEYRPFLVGEEKIFMMAREAGDEGSIFKAVTQVLNNCILTENVDPAKLAIYDLEYLFIQVRAASVGEDELLAIKCEKCGKENEIDFDFKKDIRVEQPDPTDSDLSKIDLGNGIYLKLRYPSTDQIRTVSAIENEMDNLFAFFDMVIDRVLTEDEALIFSDYPEDKRREFMDRLNTGQIDSIRRFVEHVPTVVGNIDFNCGECGERNVTELRGLTSFFTSEQPTTR